MANSLRVAPRDTFMTQVGFEPTASLGLSKGGLPVAYRVKFRGLESNQHPRVQGPMSYQLDYPGSYGHISVIRVRGEGVEPSSPGSKPGSLPLADPRDLAEGERVELSRLIAQPFSGRPPSPVGLPFRSKLRRQESNLQSSP
jgi:hypothetical protein